MESLSRQREQLNCFFHSIFFQADPNFRLLGARLKGDQKKVTEYLKNQVTEQELEQFLLSGMIFFLYDMFR